ncbi:MAG TPA: hypothetical protein VK484_11475 [Ferruginibacter sp.]|nr:hypothetical protein [Ferruginibacter sp.]
MKQLLYIFTLFLNSHGLFGQAGYSGFIGKYPIELVTHIYSDGIARAIYAYTNFDEPIVINGKLQKNKLSLFEKDKNEKNKASLTFDHFNVTDGKLEGSWTDLNTGKQLKISLTQTFDIDNAGNPEWKDRELLQAASSGNKYFKMIVSKEGGSSARVTGIKVLEKKTDRLIQQINLDCQLMGLETVSIGDYNFDGIDDLSVFESSYAGPNTSSLYFLYDRKTGKYFNSGFTGTSLEFDSKTKRVFERNQCCAGSIVTTAEYKIVNNKMVLIKKRCYKWDDKKEELVERNIKECN